MRGILAGALLAAIVICIGAIVYAPYLPRLLYEGYPSLSWPTRGEFAPINGVADDSLLNARNASGTDKLIPTLQKRMDDKNGTALLVYHKGKLVTEYYAPGFSQTSKFNSFSMAKSLVGALMFKAVAEGKLSSLDLPLGQILPDIGDDAMRQITLRGILQMRSGVLFATEDKILGGEESTKDINGGRINPFGPMAKLHMTGLAPIERSLVSEAAGQPEFSYQNVNTSILGAVLEKIYARPLQSILSEKIWMPAGAQPAFWRQPEEGAPVSAYCCIFATARDWVKIGIFLSRNGSSSRPFLPNPLWSEFMGIGLDATALNKGVYGHHINHNILDQPGEPLQGPFSYMLGSGGQVTYMMPQQDFIVVRFGYNMQLLHSTLYEAWSMASQPAGRSQASHAIP